MPDKEVLANTWNSNESGILWEKMWYRQDGRYFSHVFVSGLLAPPPDPEYPTEEAFWAAFEEERAEVYGARKEKA